MKCTQSTSPTPTSLHTLLKQQTDEVYVSILIKDTKVLQQVKKSLRIDVDFFKHTVVRVFERLHASIRSLDGAKRAARAKQVQSEFSPCKSVSVLFMTIWVFIGYRAGVGATQRQVDDPQIGARKGPIDSTSIQPHSDFNLSIRRGRPARIIGDKKFKVWWFGRFRPNWRHNIWRTRKSCNEVDIYGLE